MKLAWIFALALGVAAPALSQECSPELRQSIAEAAAFRVKQTSVIAFLEANEAEISAYRAIIDSMRELEAESSQKYQLDALTSVMQVHLDVMGATQEEFSATEFASEELPAWIVALGLAFASDTAAARQCAPANRAAIARDAFETAEREIATEFARLNRAQVSHFQAVVDGLHQLEIEAARQRQLDAVIAAVQVMLDSHRAAQREFSAIL